MVLACRRLGLHPPARLPCSSLPGVRSAGVFLLAETAHVELDPAAAADMRRVLAAVESVGFTADLLDTAGVMLMIMWWVHVATAACARPAEGLLVG